jgi:hypothetical protein
MTTRSESLKKAQKKYHESHPETYARAQAKWQQTHREALNLYQLEYKNWKAFLNNTIFKTEYKLLLQREI